jgi:predicted DNA-binding transcriptional regulator AlpA
MKALLGTADLMRIFGLSRVSIYRKVAEARAGLGRFPLPVSGVKQKLRWSVDNVEAFCQSMNTPSPISAPSPPSKITKSMQERKTQTAAILAAHGINVNT